MINITHYVSVESKDYSISRFTTNASPKSSLNVSPVVQQSLHKDFHYFTRSILARTKILMLTTSLKRQFQSDATRLRIYSTLTNNFKNSSSYVTHEMDISESTRSGLLDPVIHCHSKIGID